MAMYSSFETESVAFICVLGLLEVVGKSICFSPNGGLMVIYHGRIRKTSPTKQTSQLLKESVADSF